MFIFFNIQKKIKNHGILLFSFLSCVFTSHVFAVDRQTVTVTGVIAPTCTLEKLTELNFNVDLLAVPGGGGDTAFASGRQAGGILKAKCNAAYMLTAQPGVRGVGGGNKLKLTYVPAAAHAAAPAAAPVAGAQPLSFGVDLKLVSMPAAGGAGVSYEITKANFNGGQPINIFQNPIVVAPADIPTAFGAGHNYDIQYKYTVADVQNLPPGNYTNTITFTVAIVR